MSEPSRKPVFTPAQKLGWTVGLGVVGIGASTLYFAPNDLAFLAELSKFAPGVIIPAIALFVADYARSEARGGREAGERAEVEAHESRTVAARAEQEARSSREAGERAENEARSGRERAERAERAVVGPRKERQAMRRQARQESRRVG